MTYLSALVIATTAVVVALPHPAAAQRKETEQFERTIPFSSGGKLKLRNFSGNVTITGTGANQVTIHAVRRATRERLDTIKLDVQVHGSSIEIEANHRTPARSKRDENVVETEFEIEVPAATELDVHAFSSPLVITGVSGRQKLYSFSGRVTVRDATGPIDAQTFSGNVELDVSRADSLPSLDVETFSGDVKARVPERGQGRLEFHAFSGDFDSDLPLTLRSSSRKSVAADLGGGGSTRLRFTTFSGDVRLLK